MGYFRRSCTFNGNTILWSNGTGSEIYTDETSSLIVTYSDVEGGYLGEGNLAAVPLFINSADKNYHLHTGSSCNDAGTNLNAPANDIDDNNRPQGTKYDIGADEYLPGRKLLQVVHTINQKDIL